MPYLYVEFKIDPPIKEKIGKVPGDIKLLEENDAITGLQVLLGEKPVEEIKNSNHFKEVLEASEKKREHSADPEKEQNPKIQELYQSIGEGAVAY